MRFLIAVVAIFAIVHAVSADVVQVGRADIFPLSSTEAALGESYAEFSYLNATHIRINIVVNGLTTNPDGVHGIHVHQYGDLSTTDGSSLGGHWNPFNVSHGCDDPNRSAGDLGNWQFTGGNLNITEDFDLLTLTGTYSIIGRGIVIHAQTDDCHNVSSSGARLAAGVIGIANVAGNGAQAATSFGASGPYNAVAVLAPTTSYGTAVGFQGIFRWYQDTASSATVVRGWINQNAELGVHVHIYGDLSDRAAALNTAAHFDPQGTGVHAFPNSTDAHHAGDMGNTDLNNWNTTSSTLAFNASFSYMTIQNTANQASIIGHGFIVHTTYDHGTQPTGAAGNRYGQAVVGLTAPSSLNPSPVAPPTNTPTPSGNAATLSASLLVAFVAFIALFL